MSRAHSEGQRLVVGVAIEQPSAEPDETFESAELFGASWRGARVDRRGRVPRLA